MKEYLCKNHSKITGITFPDINIVRIRVRNGYDQFTQKDSVAVVEQDKKIEIFINQSNDVPEELVISPEKNSDSSIIYNKESELITFFYKRRCIAKTISPIYSNNKGTYVDFENPGEEYNFYGLGEKAGRLEKTGEDWVLKNNETYSYSEKCDSLYASIPFFIVVTKNDTFGIFLDQIQHSFFDFGKSKNHNKFTFGSESHHEIDFYFIFGNNPNEIVKSYFKLTGYSYFPPRRAFGHHQCRWSYKNEKQIRKLICNFKKHNVPCDMIYFDIDYMDKFKIFTVNEKAFPDIHNLLKDIKNEGYHPTFIVDPGVKEEAGYRVYEDGMKNNIFLKDSNGIWKGKVWAEGKTVFPDFYKNETRQWWANLHKNFVTKKLRTHVDIWNDMNEIAHGLKENPDDVFFEYNDRSLPYKEFHNAYALMEAKATNDYAKDSGKRTFILSRAGFSGIQRYAGIWTGDNWSNYSHLKMTISMMLNLSLSGIPIVGCDGLGYGGFCTPGAAIRWTQAMCLLPIMRFHSAKWFPPKEPWSFGKVVLKHIKKYIKLRYKFLPHLYNLAHKSHTKGELIIKPIFFDYPEDENTYNLDNQYLVGDSILVAPVVTPLLPWKKLYLPEGKWIRLEDGKEFTGRKWVRMLVPYSKCPIFIKKGSVIATQDVGTNHEPLNKTLFINVYPPEKGEILYEFYDDDGVNYNTKPTIINIKVDDRKILIKSISRGDSHYESIVVRVGDIEIKKIFLEELAFDEFSFV